MSTNDNLTVAEDLLQRLAEATAALQTLEVARFDPGAGLLSTMPTLLRQAQVELSRLRNEVEELEEANARYVNLYGLDVAERVQERTALQRYADLLQALHEIDQAILAAQTVEEVAEAALRRVPQLLDCARANVLLYDLERQEVALLAVHASGESDPGKGQRGPLDRNWERVIEKLAQGRIHVIEDIQDVSAWPYVTTLQAEGVRAYAAVPLIVEGELIGSLNLGMRQFSPLTSAQTEIARKLASQMALGIQQARLYRQVQRHAEVLEEEAGRRTAALRASQARLQAIFDNAAVGIALADTEGQLVESNVALQRMLGYTSQELRDMYLEDLAHPDDVEADGAFYRELLAGERDSDMMQKRYVRKDGQEIWVSVHVSLIRGPQREPRFTIGLVEDITERMQAQEALVQSERLAITGRLAASLAHEINNPLQSVIGCLDLAEEALAEGKEDDARQLLQIGTEELERAAGIVAQLRDLNRPSDPQDREPCDVNALIEQVLILTRKQCQKRQVEVVWKPGLDLPPVPVVPNRMQQVFLNLVLNAIEAMPGGGRLRVRTGRTAGPAGVTISFADTGQGIEAQDLPHIFDPFYTTRAEGLGLGLYVSHNVAEEHGGHIEVESRLGKGSTFEVWLPASRSG